jgi:hypothetical protein
MFAVCWCLRSPAALGHPCRSYSGSLRLAQLTPPGMHPLRQPTLPGGPLSCATPGMSCRQQAKNPQARSLV